MTKGNSDRLNCPTAAPQLDAAISMPLTMKGWDCIGFSLVLFIFPQKDSSSQLLASRNSSETDSVRLDRFSSTSFLACRGPGE